MKEARAALALLADAVCLMLNMSNEICSCTPCFT